MSGVSNHSRNSPVEGGVLSIQERIRAMNETLDTVEQRQKQQLPIKKNTMVRPTSSIDDHTEAVTNDNDDALLSLPPVVKRSSVVDIWRMRESQSSTSTTTASGGGLVGTTSSSTGSVSRQIASSILDPSKNDEMNNYSSIKLRTTGSGRINSRVDSWNSKACTVGQEEKKEEDCDINFTNNSDVSPAAGSKIVVPIRTVASASPTPPPLPGSTRKKIADVKPTPRTYQHHQELSKNSYPLVDLSIVQSTSSLSTSSGAVLQPFDTPVSPIRKNHISKVAMIREKLIHNTAAIASTSVSIASATETRPQTSTLEVRRESAIESLSPERQSVVDIWKSRGNVTTVKEDTMVTPKKDTISNISVEYLAPSMVSDAIIESITKRREPDDGIERAEEEEKCNDVQLTAGSVLPSPSRNTSIADRWARRLADQKINATEKIPAVSKLDLKDSNTGSKAAEGMEQLSMLLMNTFSTDRQESNKSTVLIQSDHVVNPPPPDTNRKSKVTDRYKVADVPSINHTVNPTVSSLVKEHAVRTPVLSYKNKKVNLPEKPISEAHAVVHVNNVHSAKSLEIQGNLSDGDSKIHLTPHDMIASSVTAVMAKQAEKRRNNVSDRWTVNTNIIGTNKSKDTSDIPKSYGKVTDRYKPKINVAASEPGVSRFDSATVAGLLKLHAGKTPAGKVRGGGIKYNNYDAQRNTSRFSNVINSNSTMLSHGESSISPPKPHPDVVDRWSLRESLRSAATIPENDGDELKILSSNIREQFITNLASSCDVEPNEYNAKPTKASSQAEAYNLETLEGNYTPVTASKGNVADRWKKHLVQAKENNLIVEGSDNSFLHKNCKQSDVVLSKAKWEYSPYLDMIGKVCTGSTEDKICDVGSDETKETTEIKNSQSSTASHHPFDIPVKSISDSDDDYGPHMRPSPAMKGTFVKSSAHGTQLSDQITTTPNTSFNSKKVDTWHSTNSMQIVMSPVQLTTNCKQINSTSPLDRKDDCVVKSTNSSAFNPWNIPGEASHDNERRNIKTASATHGTQNAADLTSQSLFMQSSNEVAVHSEKVGPSDADIDHDNSPLISYTLNTRNRLEENTIDTNNSVDQNKLPLLAVFSTTIPTTDDPEKQQMVITKLSTVDNNSLSRTMTSSTKKLASDRASNKKRLQQYRGKAKKSPLVKLEPMSVSLSSKFESTEQGHVQDDTFKSTSNPSDSAQDEFDIIGRVSHIHPTQEKTHFDLNNFLRSSGHETGQSLNLEKSDFDKEAIDTICNSASTTSSSPLASKAEKLLQNRRRRSAGGHLAPQQANTSGYTPMPQALQLYSHEDEDDDGESVTSCRNGFICSDQPRLSTRYNTSARFIDMDTSTSAPATTAYDSESAESSCIESVTAPASKSRCYQGERFLTKEAKDSSKRRKNQLKDPPGQLSKDQSLNLSSNSNWDSDWGGNTTMVSMDFDKFVSVVDEHVAAFRDFVGVGIKKHLSQAKTKPSDRKRASANVPMDTEDVAIEVEYVEDSFDDDDPKADLGFCTAPVDDLMRKSLEFSNGTERRTCVDFQLSCNEMLPTGEPSCERKSSVRKQSKRNAYV